MEDEILIVEELENRLALEAVQYKVKCDELWEQYKFDPTYFDKYISGTSQLAFKEYTSFQLKIIL